MTGTYIKRIDAKPPRTGYKLSLLSSKNKVLSLKLRAKPAHDTKDVKYLLRRPKKLPNKLIMDKGYDAEWIHRYCNNKLGVQSVIPSRKNSYKGYFRKKLKKNWPQKLYNKRSRIESTFHALKKKYGSSINSKNIGPARTEVYCRAILHNVFSAITKDLGHSPFLRKVFILDSITCFNVNWSCWKAKLW